MTVSPTASPAVSSATQSSTNLKDDQSRVGQCDAIGNGYSTRTHHMLFTD